MVDLQFHHKKHNTCSQGKKSKKDRLSELADDTILHMLSSLTMKEAGRTNVLSTRWRYVWSNIQDLTFYPPQRTKEIHKTTSYMNWVDQVTRSHSMMSSVDDFWVQCHLQAKDVEKVNRWVKFASMKGVKWLEMDIVLLSGSQLLHYTFPRFNFVSLSSLKLSRVNVTGEDLEMIFSDCFYLELVSIENSDSLVELKIAGQSLQLKYLGLFYCNKIKKLEISAPNLVQVTYYGPEIMVPFKSNPKLVKMVLGGKFVIALTNTFQKHSSYLSQLEKLEIVLECTEDSAMKSVNFPKLERLKALSVHIISPLTCLDLLYMKPLIDACPSLYKFTLTMNNDTDNRERIMRTEWTGSIHKHLKIVKIVELCGAAGVEFAICLLKIAVLEKIVIDHHKLLHRRSPQGLKAKRYVAKQLSAYLRPGTDLVIF